MKRLAPVLFGILALATLVGCTPPAPMPTTTSSPAASEPTPDTTPSPAPSPTPADAAAAIVLRPAGFDIVDEAGAVLLSHEWPQAADDAVTELTRIFGDEPVVSEEPGDAIWPGRRTYAWPGFELRDALEPTADYAFASGLYVTVAAVNSIDVRTEAGLAVGSTFDDVATVGFVHEMTIDGHHGFLLAEAGPGGEQGSYKLAGGGEAASGILTSFSVPVAWGA